MAFVAARSSIFKLDNAGGVLTDISAYVDSVSGISNSTDMLDTTVFGSTSKSYAPGLRNGDTIQVSGKWDATLNTHITGLLGQTTSSSFEYSPAGTSGGTPKVTGECYVASYEVSSAVADLVTFSLTLQMTGNVTHGSN